MSTIFKLKKSAVVGRKPEAGDIQHGELAINYADGRLYYKNAANEVRYFVDSAHALSMISNNSVDSAQAITLINANSINNADALTLIQNNSVDSASVFDLIDSDYVAQRHSTPIAAANSVILDRFSGDSSTTAFTLSYSPTEEQHALVFVNGAIQQTDTYSLNGSTLNLGAAPVTGDDVEVRTIRVQTSSVNVKDHFQYVFQPSTTTSTFTGNDLNTNALSYDVGKLEVYWNGARLTNGLDYTATTGNSIVLLGDAATSGDTIVVNSFGTASLLRDINSLVLTTTDANQAVDTYNKTTSRTTKYIVQMTQNSRYHSVEVLLNHDGTNAAMVAYGEVWTDADLGTLDADIVGDAVRLLVSPNFANTTVKTTRTEIGV
jgi:hypothetical protein